MSSQRVAWRSSSGRRFMRPGNADIESALVESSVSGIAITNASARPAVAMATVRQHSCNTSSKNSPLIFGGKKSARKRPVDFRLPDSNSTQGLNSVAASAGSRNASAAMAQNTRPHQAGSRNCGARGAVAADTGGALDVGR